jgi:uncharacterized protein
LRNLDRVLAWLGLAYLALAAAIVVASELASILRHGFERFWSDGIGPRELASLAVLLAPGLLLLALGGLAERRRFRSALRPAWDEPRPAMYLAGCVLFSLGVKLFLDAGLGVDPLHALTVGVVRAVDLPYVGVGLVDGALTLALLAVWAAWNRQLPPLSTFATMVLVGLLIDLWNVLDLEHWTTRALDPALLMLLGLLLVAYGSAMIIMSGVGIRVVDLVALTMVRRLRWRFYLAKLALEAGFLVGGLAFGGPVGVATLAFVCVVGPFVEPIIWANRRFLGLPDHGLRRAAMGARGSAP